MITNKNASDAAEAFKGAGTPESLTAYMPEFRYIGVEMRFPAERIISGEQ